MWSFLTPSQVHWNNNVYHPCVARRIFVEKSPFCVLDRHPGSICSGVCCCSARGRDRTPRGRGLRLSSYIFSCPCSWRVLGMISFHAAPLGENIDLSPPPLGYYFISFWIISASILAHYLKQFLVFIVPGVDGSNIIRFSCYSFHCLLLFEYLIISFGQKTHPFKYLNTENMKIYQKEHPWESRRIVTNDHNDGRKASKRSLFFHSVKIYDD